jgi:hypothetical protein
MRPDPLERLHTVRDVSTGVSGWWPLVCFAWRMNWNDVKKKITTDKSKERRRIDFIPQQKLLPSAASSFTKTAAGSGQETSTLVNRNKNMKKSDKKTEIYPRNSIIQYSKWNSIRRYSPPSPPLSLSLSVPQCWSWYVQSWQHLLFELNLTMSRSHTTLCSSSPPGLLCCSLWFHLISRPSTVSSESESEQSSHLIDFQTSLRGSLGNKTSTTVYLSSSYGQHSPKTQQAIPFLSTRRCSRISLPSFGWIQ